MKQVCLKTILMVFACAVLFAQAALAAPMKVTVGKVQGTVQVKDGAAWKTLKSGDTVASGAEVKTGAGSSCILKWAGGNVVKVGPMSTMSVTADKVGADEKSKVDIRNGKVSAHAKKLGTANSSFNVSTPTAVAGVRGTDIIAEIAAGNVSFGVADGQLEVTAGDETFVLDDGFLMEVDPAGEVSPPVAIPPAMMEDLKEEFEELKAEAAQDEALAGDDEDEGDEKANEDDEDENADEGDDEDSDMDTDADMDSDEDSDMDMSMDGDDMGDDFGDDFGDDLGDLDITDNIDEILDTELNNEIVDDANNEYITGDLEVIIILEEQTTAP